MAGLRSQLESMGADLVLTEEEMRATKVTDPTFQSFFTDTLLRLCTSHMWLLGVEIG